MSYLKPTKSSMMRNEERKEDKTKAAKGGMPPRKALDGGRLSTGRQSAMRSMVEPSNSSAVATDPVLRKSTSASLHTPLV